MSDQKPSKSPPAAAAKPRQTAAKKAPAKKTAARPAAAKPSVAQPSVAKPAVAETPVSRDGAGKAGDAKVGDRKAREGKAAASKPSANKPPASTASAGKSSASKPSASKPSASKGPGKSGDAAKLSPNGDRKRDVRPAPSASAPAPAPADVHPDLIRVPMPVRWRDLDAFNHVNNSKYLSYLEEARLHWMLGVPGQGMDDHVAPVVAAAQLNYRRPITWPAQVMIELFVERLGNTSLSIGHRIVDDADRSIIYCDGNVVMVWIDRDSGRAAALPASVREACSDSN